MAYRTVKIKKYSDIIEEYVADTGATITPGMLLKLADTGKVVPHDVAGGSAEKIFALEDELQGRGIDDNYVDGDPVQCWVAGRGDQVYAILTTSQTVAIGDLLESNGDGHLREYTGTSAGAAEYPESIVGVALEAATTTSATSRIRIRAI
jgi:hypothetical protein